MRLQVILKVKAKGKESDTGIGVYQGLIAENTRENDKLVCRAINKKKKGLKGKDWIQKKAPVN